MINNNQITKKQHFIPRFYLKNFTNENNEVERLDCVKREIIAPSGPKGIAYGKFYFGIKTGKQDQTSQDFEDAIEGVEHSIAKRIPKIIKDILDYKKIEHHEKEVIAILMALIWMSVPTMRNQINRTTEDFTRKVFKSFIDNVDPKAIFPDSEDDRSKFRKSREEELFSLKFEQNNLHHLSFYDNIEEFAKLFLFKRWTIYISKASSKFITSDNPVVEILPDVERRIRGTPFLQRTHLFPLTPEILICANPTETTMDIGKKVKRKTLYEKNEDWFKIHQCNCAQYMYADKYAYARQKAGFEEIINYVNYCEQNDKKN